MRWWWLVVLAGCQGYRSVAPHRDDPGCKITDTLVDVGPEGLDPAAPLVMVYEHHSFSPSEMLAVWGDGAVVATGERGLVQGRIPAADARRLATRVATDLTRSAGYTELDGPVDQPRVEIIVRDGPRWRHAELWGAGHHRTDRGPPAFLDAYRALLAVEPAATLAFQPADVALTFEPTESAEPAIAWPESIPTTPIVDAAHAAALQALLAEANAQRPPHPVTFGGKRWIFDVHLRMRGQAATDRVWECVARD